MKRASLAVGILTLLAAWSLAVAGESSFAAHMVAHMGVDAVAAPLIALGLASMWQELPSRPIWVTPLTASIMELVVVWF